MPVINNNNVASGGNKFSANSTRLSTQAQIEPSDTEDIVRAIVNRVVGETGRLREDRRESGNVMWAPVREDAVARMFQS